MCLYVCMREYVFMCAGAFASHYRCRASRCAVHWCVCVYAHVNYMCMYIACVCVYVCVYVCIYVCMYMHVCTCVVSVCVHGYVCMYVCGICAVCLCITAAAAPLTLSLLTLSLPTLRWDVYV